jgi:hypothetical protein
LKGLPTVPLNDVLEDGDVIATGSAITKDVDGREADESPTRFVATTVNV